MNRPALRSFLFVALGLCLAAGAWTGWHYYEVRRAWTRLRPPTPATVGDSAPGLDTRFAMLSARLQTFPPDVPALAEFAELCHANGQLESAVIAYEALRQLQPRQARWPYLLSAIIAGYGQLDEAIPLLRRTTELAPDYVVAWLKLGDAYLKSNATPAAEAAYEEVQRRDPENRYALLGLARCDLQADRLSAARAHLLRTVSGVTDFAGAQSLLATVYAQLGNMEAAAAARDRVQRSGHYTEPVDPWLEELQFKCHDPYVLLTAASTAAIEDRTDRAFALLERGLSLAPEDGRLHRQFGRMLTARGDLAGARLHLERAVAAAPANDSFQHDLIGVLHQQNDTAALERVVAAGLQANPDSAALHFEAGMIASAAGRFDDAARHLEFTWKTSPDQMAAAIELANVYFQTGRAEAGVTLVEEALKRFPQKQAPLLLVLIRHGIESGDSRTRGWLQLAVESDPPSGLLADLRRDFQRRFGEQAP